MFLHPLMLAGIGGAAAPLVLHLLNRLRLRDREWGAMMFLPGADPRQRRAVQMRQIVLLLLRMAAIAALAIALARPIMGWWGTPAERSPTCTVLLLDCSASMSCKINGQSRLDLAKRAALSLLQSMSSGDEVCLIKIDGDLPDTEPTMTADLRPVAARIADAVASADASELAASLASAFRAVDATDCRQRRIVLITDRQASSWEQAETIAPQLQRALKEPDRKTSFIVIPVGGADDDMVAIEAITITSGPILRDLPCEAEVRVKNHGATARSEVPLTFSAGGREIGRSNVSVASRSSASARIRFKLDTSGSHVLSVRIGASVPTILDHADLSVEVHDPIRVLILAGNSSMSDPGGMNGASAAQGFLRAALAPFASVGESGADAATVEWIDASLDPAPEVGHRRCDVLVLANVGPLDAALAGRIERFVHDGGGLLIAPGNLVGAENYNSLLFRDAHGAMPARLIAAPAAGTGASSRGMAIDSLDASHPVFAFLQDRPNSQLPASIERYFKAEPADGAQVIATIAGGDAFLIERKFGRGQVILSTCPLDAGAGLLPLTSFYLPMMQSLARYLVGGTDPVRNGPPGEPIIATIKDATGNQAAMIPPDGVRQPLELDQTAEVARVRWDATHRSGRYELRYRNDRAERVMRFVVTTPASELDPTPLDESGWMRLQSQLGFRRGTPDSISGGKTVAAASEIGQTEWMCLIALVVSLLFVESMLTRTWQIGSVGATNPGGR